MSCMVCACGQEGGRCRAIRSCQSLSPLMEHLTLTVSRWNIMNRLSLKGIEQQNGEIKAIVENPEEPTFENTIVALDNSGEILARERCVLF